MEEHIPIIQSTKVIVNVISHTPENNLSDLSVKQGLFEILVNQRFQSFTSLFCVGMQSNELRQFLVHSPSKCFSPRHFVNRVQHPFQIFYNFSLKHEHTEREKYETCTVGFFQSNGILRNKSIFKFEKGSSICAYSYSKRIKAYHIGIGKANASLPASVVK